MKRIGFYMVAVLLAVLAVEVVTTPSPGQVRRLALGSDRVLLASDGQVLQTLRMDFHKRRLAWYPLPSFPENLRQHVILAEDQRFRSHFGFDPLGLARAAWAMARGHRVQGASTITMQLSDLIEEDVLVHNQPIKKGSLVHKMIQLVRALGLEARWRKDDILEAYLNLIHLRGEYQGVPAAALAYLDKAPQALDASESAVIASMISSPNRGRAQLQARACALLQRAHSDCADVAPAVAAFFQATPSIPSAQGLTPHLARRLFNENPGESIMKSTIDHRLQEEVEGILARNIAHLTAANVHDTAAIVIENRTGRVLAYVGALPTSPSPHVDGVQAYRQAGSSLKPFLYAKAFDNKTLTPASILLDDPTAISWGSEVYRPSNYDKHFYGPVTVREALGSSLNVPAVKTVMVIGLHQAYHTLQNIGLTGLKEPDFYGVSMALGAVEVRLEDLANAYRMLANGGLWTPLRFTDSPRAEETRRVYSPEAAYLVSTILSDPDARAIGFGWENPLETPFWTAVKTGTSKDYRDNWCVGFSRRYTVGVWTGNFNAEAMKKVSGVSGAGPSWFEIMNLLHRGERSTAPAAPARVVAKRVRHQWQSRERTEYFIRGTEPAGDVIEPAPEKHVEFIFPADGSVLVKDPHADQQNVALYVRFKGQVPQGSQLMWDDKPLGPAVSPFRLDQPVTGKHRLAIAADGKLLSAVQFTIKGAE